MVICRSKSGLRLFILFLLPGLLWVTPKACGQSLAERLNRKTNFVPQSSEPADQLVEIAKRFEIPMAIEWLDQPNEEPRSAAVFSGSVLQLIESIVQRSRQQTMIVQERMVYIFPPVVVEHPFNFLNLRIPHYRVKNESLLGANFMLRISIDMLLDPTPYDGYAGGYGSAPDDPFWKPNITVSGQNLTVREILNKVAKASGNALWVVNLRQDEFAGDKPKWIGVAKGELGSSQLDGRWRFIALRDVNRDTDK
jgi:hypothetical protein